MIKLYICCSVLIIGSVEVGLDMDMKFHQEVMEIVSYDTLKVLKAFEDYFKPAQNKYHCWYSLSGIYSSQFKSQSEFMVKLCECVRECSFEKPDEVVKFLFLMHNQNARVCEELLKSMKFRWSQ